MQERLQGAVGGLDRIEVRGVRGQIPQARTGGVDRFLNPFDLVGRDIDGVDAPLRHRCAKVVSLIIT